MYKNPIKIKGHENSHFGDPFIFRFDGKYYLYPSTKGGDSGVHCYVSEDLINFKYYGKVFDDEISECAYAPEVTYYNGNFYLITSPRGNGHYLYKAKSPLGPFIRVSENIHNMIDGSFYINRDNELHLLRANHNGISILKMNELGETYSRNDLNAPMCAWTEGPGLFYFNKNYYLTYTGNNVAATGYRVDYATSKKFNSQFIPGENNSILISTEGKITRFGHSSNVLGPDLDSHYIVYHELRIKDNLHLPRRFLVDRLNFNGRMMVANSSIIKNDSPRRPLYEGYGLNENLNLIDEFNLYPKTFSKFTLEALIKNKTSIIVGYKNSKNYYEIRFNENIELIKKHLEKETLINSYPNKFNFDYLHTVRVIYGDKDLEILIDDALIYRIEDIEIKGKVGFKNASKDDISYNAIVKEAYNSSQKNYRDVVPGKLLAKNDRFDIEDKFSETYASCLKEKDKVKYKLRAKKGKYFLTIDAHTKSDVKLKINDEIYTLRAASKEFDFYNYRIGFVNLKEIDELNIEVIEGQISYRFLDVIDETKLKKVNHLDLSIDQDKYFLSENKHLVNEISFKLRINEKRLYQKAGFLFQASNYSDDIHQARYPITSFVVGIEDGLMTLDYFNYSFRRIYDVPSDFKEENLIKVVINNSNVKVYLNENLRIDTNVPYLHGYGRIGLFKNKESDVEIYDLNYVEEKDE